MEQDTAASPLRDDELKRQLQLAYEAGAMDVHENWQEDRDPDFSEAASDYVASLDFAALTPTQQDVGKLVEALEAVEPHLDAIVCYASAMGEHEPNRIAVKVREAIRARSTTGEG